MASPYRQKVPPENWLEQLMSKAKSASSVAPVPNEILFKTPEAAKYIRVSRRTLMTYCRKRLIAHHQYKAGKGGFRFRQSDLDAFLQRTYVPARAA